MGKHLGVLVDSKHEPECAQWARRPMALGPHQQQCGQQDQGGDCLPVLGTAEAPPILGSVLGPSLHDRQ